MKMEKKWYAKKYKKKGIGKWKRKDERNRGKTKWAINKRGKK